jgi:predicted branched-subunit amino acid permease
VLAVEQWRSSASAMPLWTALLAYAVAYALLPGQALLISIALCVVAAMVFHLRDQRVREAA